MSARGVRIVVGEGPSTRKGLLRFVVDGEGYDVVAEASTTAELARLMATHRPDVVVLDDGIGATAVGMINEMSPNTKVVLVWPGAVMPVGGAARVEPARVLQDLGPTIERLTGQQSATNAGRGSALIDSATNDPDMLKAMLLGGMATSGEAIIEDREPAPVVILPLTPTIDHDELILNVPDAESDDEHAGASAAAGAVAGVAGAAALAGSVPAAASESAGTGAAVTSIAARGGAVGAQSALNRRLGNLALSGAAVASAIVLALALGGTRVSPDDIRGQVFTPPITSPGPGSDGTTGSDEEPGDGGNGDGNDDRGGDGGNGTLGGDLGRTGSPSVTLGGTQTPEPPGPPDVGIDPGDIGPGGEGDGGGGDDGGGGGGGGSGIDDGGGGDDHSGGDAGGEDRSDGGGGDHDKGGGNDGDGDDHDNGGGNDDPDNPGGNGRNGNGAGAGAGGEGH